MTKSIETPNNLKKIVKAVRETLTVSSADVEETCKRIIMRKFRDEFTHECKVSYIDTYEVLIMESENEDDVIEAFEILKHYPKKYFLEVLIEVINKNGITSITPDMACMVYDLYPSIGKRYPMFSKQTKHMQYQFLQQACLRAIRFPKEKRDSYVLAKHIFDVLNENALTGILLYDGKTWSKVFEMRKDRRNFEKKAEIWERNCLIWVEYETYLAKTDSRYRQSIHENELHNCLLYV